MARDDEFRQAVATLDRRADFRGVALIGDSGVGKSTLARALAKTLESAGRTVRFVLGTKTGSTVPLGAFSRSVTIDADHEPAAMLAAAHENLEQEKDLVIVVDDAQLLDPLSATLVYQLASGGSARLIVTIRSGDPVHDAVRALWKEQRLLMLRIHAFSREQTGQLAHRVLGGAVEHRLIDELYSRTAGNPLLLRGLLRAGRDTGVLVLTEHGWQLHGALRPHRELYDLLEFWLQSLTPEELDAVEILATGELLDWEVLRGVCDADAVAGLERRGLIQLVADGSDTVARLNHPVIGEVAIACAGVVRFRQVNGLLAQALQKRLQAGERRSRVSDVRSHIRVARFMMRSDLAPDLDLIIHAAVSALRMWNVDCAEELARFALDHGGGLPAAIVLADALGWQGRSAEVEGVLTAVQPEGPEKLVTSHGCLLAANLFWCGEIEKARLALANVRQRVKSEASAGLSTAIEVAFAFFSGDVSAVIETGLPLCECDMPPVATAWAAAATCWALALTGRYGDVHPLAEKGLRAAALGRSGPLRLVIGWAEVLALTATGNYSAAEQVWERYAAMPAGAPALDGVVHAMLGLVNLARGVLPSACAALENSLSAMSHGSPFSWLMLVAAWSAQAEAARGNHEAAAGALRISDDAHGPHTAVFLPELELARAWQRASVGETTAAQKHSVRAAQIARRSGMWDVEMRALHTAVRFGDRSHAARLGQLAETLNTPIAQAIAAHARGLANHDGDLLEAAAHRFAEMGALAFAADAAAQAAREHLRSGRVDKELESSARAYRLARQGRVRTPAIKAAARPLPITDREREIAMLVAAGLPNRQIADRLSLSVRTVDGHLYRIFAKLGIQHRDELVHLISGSPAGT